MQLVKTIWPLQEAPHFQSVTSKKPDPLSGAGLVLLSCLAKAGWGVPLPRRCTPCGLRCWWR
jgi:hypothetical protein